MEKIKVKVGKYQIGDFMQGKKIKSFGTVWTEKLANGTHLEGQLWEECSCGIEPVYMPHHKCMKCVNRMYGVETQVCYAYFE